MSMWTGIFKSSPPKKSIYEMLFSASITCNVQWCIAGGALRDSYFNKPVKDLDVFVFVDREFIDTVRMGPGCYLAYHAPLGRIYFTHNKPSSTGFEEIWKVVTDSPSSGYGPHKRNFISCHMMENPEINIIFVEKNSEYWSQNVEELLEQFPASISRVAYYPPDDTWLVDESFKETARMKLIKVRKNAEGRQYYAEKLKDKYGMEFSTMFV